jgi:GNAT superfamily N-acetyltransferase
MSTPADDTKPPGLWACRALRPDGSTAWVAGTASDRHGDGELVELPEADALAYVGEAAIAVAHLDPRGAVIGIRISAFAAPKAPAMWFAELPEERAAPPATNLLAFTGFDVEPGRLLDRAALHATGAWTEDQLGAIRLYPASGEVDQIYVSPQWRRRNVGTALTYVAGILAYTRSGPLPWGDGQRTADGDRLVKASIWRHRAAPLTNLAPPMTPFEDR